MKTIVAVTFLGLTLALSANAKPSKNCAVAYASGDSCKNLRVDFNLKGCGVSSNKKPVIKCGGSTATATIEADKWVFKTNLKRYVGQNSSAWDVSGEVTSSEKPVERVVTEENKPVEKPAEPVAAVSSSTSVSPTAVVAAVSAAVVTAPVAPVAPVATVSTTTLASAPAVAQPVAVSAPAEVKEVKTEFVPTIKTNSLLQFWYLEDQSAIAASADKNFRVRRAEFKLTGSSADNARWFFMADFAKSIATTSTSVVTSTSPTTKTTSVDTVNTTGDTKVLQDMGVAFKIINDLEVTVGQFKLPTTAESAQPTGELLFAERSLLTRTYGERRDPGAMVSYKYEKVKILAATSNGQGPNVDEKNDRKDYTARFEATLPYGLTFGTFVMCKDAICYDPNRYGVNLGWTYNDLNLRAEYVNGNISSVRSTALMVDAGYKLSDKWQLASRYESLQPNVANDYINSAAAVGVNYFVAKQNLKFQLNHTQLFNMRGSNGSYTGSSDQIGSLIIFAIQNSF